MIRHVLATLLGAALAVGLLAHSAFGWDPNNVVPARQRAEYRNEDGSCVYCAIALMGAHQGGANGDNMAHMLHASKYGPACRGGSWPERVNQDLRARGIEAWNIEGDTLPWIEWALRNGRWAAVTLTSHHMQTVVGMSDDRQRFYVVDNNSTHKIDEWPRDRFVAAHTIHGGGWCVVPKGPAPLPWVPPKLTSWWKEDSCEIHDSTRRGFSVGRLR